MSEMQYFIEGLVCFKETCKRTLGEIPYDEQLCAGMALFSGKIVDMPNGEGKTLSGAVAAFLKYIANRNVHMVTANEYLAKRDAEWMGPLYHSLGITVALLQDKKYFASNNDSDEFQLVDCSNTKAYNCDVIYGSANDYIFNYLRDNLEIDIEQMVDTNFNSVIIDEIDSILIDEARTPCVISKDSQSDKERFILANQIMSEILEEINDYFINYKDKTIEINQCGISKLEKILNVSNIYDPRLLKDNKLRGFIPAMENAIKAYKLYHEDIDYFIQNENVVIIDELTGRPRYNSKFGGGLHQALELKHELPLSTETVEIAKITFQKYFQKYKALSGMSGTAAYDEAEYDQLYGKDVVCIPSRFNKLRIDKNDLIYRTKEELYESAVDLIQRINRTGQPILIGTLSLAAAEQLANRLRSVSIRYELLHAKHHMMESEILENAGKIGAVTIAAKMAGRGTDIKIESAVERSGGLFVLGIERQESRRIDSQLKGRTARHGKPGVTQFALSLEDEFLLIFGGEVIGRMMEKLGMEDGEAIENRLISKAINNAQNKVERHNFLIRKNLYEYDNILDKHRNEIYGLRKTILIQEDAFDSLNTIITNIINRKLIFFNRKLSKKNFEDLLRDISYLVGQEIVNSFVSRKQLLKKEVFVWTINVLIGLIEKKKKEIGSGEFSNLFRFITLQTIDNCWSKHLLAIDTLKSKMSMNIYRKMDFIDWYNIESSKLYDSLIEAIEAESLAILLRVKLVEQGQLQELS
nr:hypothetical protein [Desulfosarcina ovata]